MNGADLSTVVPASEMRGENDAETEGLMQMLADAQGFLTSFPWCKRIEESFFGLGYAGIVAVFLFRIDPAREGVDDWLWVIVGDLPPAYLVTEGNLTPDLAVDGYIQEMTKWIKAAKEGRPVQGLIPVNALPTPDNADALERRLHALSQIIKETLAPHKFKQFSRGIH